MLIVGNWKAYIESTEKAKKLFADAKRLTSHADTKIVLALPAPYLGLFAPMNRSKVALAAQDLSLSIGGAATGEVTAALLKNLGVAYVLLGHSERRALGETNEIVAEKVRQALTHKLIPIVCIGEREHDAEANYLTFIRVQIDAVFQPLSPKERAQIIVAYEPIWAIGKSAADAMTPRDLTEMVLYVRKILSTYLPGRAAEKVPIIYGGSVEPLDINALAEGTGVNGFLPGHASVNSVMFTDLVKAIW